MAPASSGRDYGMGAAAKARRRTAASSCRARSEAGGGIEIEKQNSFTGSYFLVNGVYSRWAPCARSWWRKDGGGFGRCSILNPYFFPSMSSSPSLVDSNRPRPASHVLRQGVTAFLMGAMRGGIRN